MYKVGDIVKIKEDRFDETTELDNAIGKIIDINYMGYLIRIKNTRVGAYCKEDDFEKVVLADD